MISLAARTIKGEGCGKCGSLEYKSPIRGSIDLVDEFVDALADLVNIASEQAADLVLSAKANFSITKLATVYDEFTWLQTVREEEMEAADMEEMWCHGNQGCFRWDYFCRSDEHLEKCHFNQFVHAQMGYGSDYK